MKQLAKSLVAVIAPTTEMGKRFIFEANRNQEVLKLRLAADAIERMIVGGYYATEAYRSWYMCLTLRVAQEQGVISREARHAARYHIMTKIFPRSSLLTHLRYAANGSVDELMEHVNRDEFEERLFRSNWYWGFIRELRARACILEHETYGGHW
jgi:hypothetical protein